MRFDLHDGLEVICQGSLDVYGPRGSYQLVIRQIEPKGMGALKLALAEAARAAGCRRTFRSRAANGPLPRFPRRIAFVTSPTGAAIRDFLEVLRRRWAGVRRAGRAGARARTTAPAPRLPRASSWSIGWPIRSMSLVVGRGGGSLEDLWSFNEEIVVRAIHASRIPIVSAVGHEIDVTLADLVADVRA